MRALSSRPALRAVALLALIGCGGDAEKPAPDTAAPDTAPADTDDSAIIESLPGETADTATDTTPLRISEVMADNHATLEVADGSSPDWIELYNPGLDPVDLSGWSLNDGDEPAPLSGVLGGGGFVVVYASGDGAGEGEVHLPFKLDAAGETLTLTRPDGSVADAVDVPALPEDISWGIAQDVVTTVLAGHGSPARLAYAAPEGWAEPLYDDSAWADATLGVGFDGTVTAGDPLNVALDGTAAQSTEYGGYPASNAVDAEPSTFTHTNTADLSPWWEVTLAADARIESVSILNRAECCGERLYNLVITAMDADGAEVWASDVLNPVAADATPTSPGAGLTVTLDTPAVARTVRVTKTAVGGIYSSEWLSLAEVVVTGAPSAPYEDAITTVIAAAPAYVRVPFTLDATPTRLTLDVAYDGGFAAWIDGAPVASANDGGDVATAAHDGDTAETFVLDPRAVSVGGGVLALAALNLPTDADDLLLRPTLVATTITNGGPAYFDAPTPGEPNGAGFDGFVDPPVIDPPRGFYDTAFSATITAPPTRRWCTRSTGARRPSPTAPSCRPPGRAPPRPSTSPPPPSSARPRSATATPRATS